MAAKKKKAKLPGFSKAVKLVVSNKEKIDGQYRYMIAGLLVSSTPLPNIPVDDKGALVLEGVDLSEDDELLCKIEPLFEALARLPARKIIHRSGRSADQFLLSLKEV